jgi:uncharacterized protein
VIEVVDNPQLSQYEAFADGELVGFAAYNQTADAVLLPHVEVRREFNGQGIGTQLAKHALDDVRRQGLRAVPLCPFVVDFVARHPEYQDVVTSL